MYREIRQNLTIFFVNFPVKGTCEGIFLLKLQAVLYQMQFYQRWTSFAGFVFILTKSVDQSVLEGYFYSLLSLKLFSQNLFVLLKLLHLITPILRLDQSNKIHFATSWWALIIKGRCNTLFKWHLVKCHFDFHWIVSR